MPKVTSADFWNLRNKVFSLEDEVSDLKGVVVGLQHLPEAVEQLQRIIECGHYPAPVFLRWHITTEDSCPVARATFGKYLLEVVDGMSCTSWSVQKGDQWVDAGGGYCGFEKGQDEAEAALVRIIQAQKPPKG